MSYIIKEVHIVYFYHEISEVAVLWQSNERGWVRASYCNTKPIFGWKFLLPRDVLSPELIQEVAGQGLNLPDEKKKVYFPGKNVGEIILVHHFPDVRKMIKTSSINLFRFCKPV